MTMPISMSVPGPGAALRTTPYRLLIGNQWLPAAQGLTLPSINPSTGQTIAHIAAADEQDVEHAVAVARRAFDEGPWRRFSPYERQMLLLRFADLVEKHGNELCQLDSMEMGAPIGGKGPRIHRALSIIRYHASLARTIQGETIGNSLPNDLFSYTMKEPVGVVAAIIAWNAPLGAALTKLCPALATGCTVVLKPAEEASLSSLRLGELLLEAGLPPGVVNIVTGYGHVVGAALAAHPAVDKVAFTGSVPVGQKIVQASAGNLKRLSLELGGKSPNIVFADADMAQAVPGAAMAVFANTGQICSAGTRLFVQRDIYEEFVARVAEHGRGLLLGNSLDPATQIGPLVSARQHERVTDYFRIGQEEGARAVSGARPFTSGELSQGFFVPPTVFADVRDDMRIAREEIFGPVISAMPFDGIEEVVQRSNASTFGLGSGVWTRDVAKVHRLARELRAGSVWVNCYQAMDPAVPFGGYRMSGYGREGGVHHADEFLQSKAVWIRTN
jgi:aldehyde dehydrogenase (NAD+)